MNDGCKPSPENPPSEEGSSVEAKQKTKQEKKKKKNKSNGSMRYALTILITTFFISLSFSFFSETMVEGAPAWAAIILLIVLIAVNIIFDMIAVAVTSCNLEPFLAMAARKISGAKMAVKILKNAEKVSNICADVVGDICGIISGSLSAAIVAVLLASGLSWDKVFVSILFSSVTAAFTVGGKAFGKKFAMVNAQKIVFTVAKIFSVFQKNP